MDVVTLGESMVLFNPSTEGSIKYVYQFTKSIAGAESNVAIALALLGHQVGWISQLGDDGFGHYIRSIIAGEGVDVSQVTFTSDHPTGILFKERFSYADPNVYYYRSHSAASKLTPGDLNESYIKQAKILHVTGITPALSESARKTVLAAIDIAKRNGVLVSFDPNIRLKLWDIETAKPILLDIIQKTDILFPGIDEASMLIGSSDPEDIIRTFHKMGCSLIALKLGKDGCYLSNGAKAEFVQGFPVKRVVDTVGAGDGFAAGILSGILQKKSLLECGRLANAIGALATMATGDMEGYPTRLQVQQFLGESKLPDR